MVSWVLPDFKVQWLVEETKRNIPRELDFVVEAENTEKARQMFNHMPWLKVRLRGELCRNILDPTHFRLLLNYFISSKYVFHKSYRFPISVFLIMHKCYFF